MSRARIAAAFVVVVLCGAAGGFYLSWLRAGDGSTVDQALPDVLANTGGSTTATTSTSEAAGEPEPEPVGGRGPQLVYISRASDHYGKVVVAAGSPPVPLPVDVACDRVHVGPTRALCLEPGFALGATANGVIFDRAFGKRNAFGLPGLPSRTRMSPDGRYAAYTLFVTGHTYLGGGEFSTFSAIVDLESNRQVTLEEFEVVKDGRRFLPEDRNFWGVTFAKDPREFYATMKTGDTTYLMKGDQQRKRMEVVTENAECPSLSPDNTKMTFKIPVGQEYRLVLFDPATRTRRMLDAAGAVDDQIEWLDDDTILYAVARQNDKGQRSADIWSLDLAEGATPQLLVADAESPAVVRG
jgi:hypothetical protein